MNSNPEPASDEQQRSETECAQLRSELSELRAQLRAMHHPRAMRFLDDTDCAGADGVCDDHPNGCPMHTLNVCAECYKTGDSQSEWETFVADSVMWPCATALVATMPNLYDEHGSTNKKALTTVHFNGGPWANRTYDVECVVGPVFAVGHDVGGCYWLDTKSDPPTYHWRDR